MEFFADTTWGVLRFGRGRRFPYGEEGYQCTEQKVANSGRAWSSAYKLGVGSINPYHIRNEGKCV
jgi:hypothetical protein